MTGGRTERGYGAEHRRLRERWRPIVDGGGVMCARCWQHIVPGTAWDLDHHDTDRSRWLGPSHLYCNRSEAGRKSGELARQLRTRPAKPHPGLR